MDIFLDYAGLITISLVLLYGVIVLRKGLNRISEEIEHLKTQ